MPNSVGTGNATPEFLPEQTELPAEVIALNLVLTSGAILYLDTAGEPRIRRKGEGATLHPSPIRSAEIEAWVERLFFDSSKRLLSRGQIDRVLLYLAGKAEDHQQTDIELCDAVDTEPVLRFLVRLVNHERYLKTTVGDLLKRLNELAVDQPFVLRSERWPRDPVSLGRRLRRLCSWLDKAGIEIDFSQREATHRWIVLTDGSDTSQGTLSSEPSYPNELAPNGLRQAVGTDGKENFCPEDEFNQLMKEMPE
jgi:hypothetical protein